MKKTFCISFILLAAMFLGACAFTGPQGPAFTEMLIPGLVKDSGTGRVFFYRPGGFGALLQPEIMLNDKKVGNSIPMSFFYLDLPPGEYVAATTTEVTRKVSFTLEKGQTRYIRFDVSFGFFVGHVYGELVGEQFAVADLNKCCRLKREIEATETKAVAAP